METLPFGAISFHSSVPRTRPGQPRRTQTSAETMNRRGWSAHACSMARSIAAGFRWVLRAQRISLIVIRALRCTQMDDSGIASQLARRRVAHLRTQIAWPRPIRGSINSASIAQKQCDIAPFCGSPAPTLYPGRWKRRAVPGRHSGAPHRQPSCECTSAHMSRRRDGRASAPLLGMATRNQ